MIPALTLDITPSGLERLAAGSETLVFATVGRFRLVAWVGPAGSVETRVHLDGVLFPLGTDGSFGRPAFHPRRALPAVSA